METLGIARGNTVRVRHVEKDILASFRYIVGGEIEEYTKLLAESREQSIDRMIIIAEDIGADGIIYIRFTTSSIMQAAAEMFVYVTAVKLKKKKKAQLLLRGEQSRGWRHVKSGAILKVKVELDKSVRVVIRNQIKEKSTFKITPFKEGLPIEDKIILSSLTGQREKSEYFFGMQLKLDEILIEVEEGLITVLVTKEYSSFDEIERKEYFLMEESGQGLFAQENST